MKLEKILDLLNSFEKNSFLKIIDGIRSENPKNSKEIEKVLSNVNGDFKSMDNINISKVFALVENSYAELVKSEFVNTTSQLDILADILTKDGNCIMKLDWFARLYEKELKALDKRSKEFHKALVDEKSEIGELRKRDYEIYRSCLNTAYGNDEGNNLEKKITNDELSILLTLAKQLELSQEEVKLINYSIIPVQKQEVDNVVNYLKNTGVVFFSKKTNTIYVADEVVRILRKIRGKEVADKFFRRTLRQLREPQINLICRKHNIDWKLPIDQKIRHIINEGISFSNILINDIHKDGTKLLDRKKVLNELCDKGLKISPSLKGVTIDEKVANLITYFEEIERDEKIGISIDGYEKLLTEVGSTLTKLNNKLRDEFELQEESVLKGSYLLNYNIKPRDVLEVLANEELLKFCKDREIKSKGDLIANILDSFKDAENLYLENYENIAYRNYNVLKDNGIIIREAEIGIKFEELTKAIFRKLGFDVDEKLRKQLCTAKDKIDIILNIGQSELILIECKTNKDSGYNKFSSVSRQLKAYTALAKSRGYAVRKTLLVAPEFSDGFVKDCGLQYDLDLSLIEAKALVNILNGFKLSKLNSLPHNLLTKDMVIQADRVVKAIER